MTAIQDSFDDLDQGICILSFDSGGPGTYSQLLLIKEYMSRLAIELGVDQNDLYPADYFDLMGGVGLGGLVAFMLGYLRMNVDQATDAILTIASAVFPYDPEVKMIPEDNMKNLEGAMEDILQESGIPLDTKMYDKRFLTSKCKVVVYAASSANISHARAFRTYTTRGTTLNPTIVQALCATMAMPSLFSAVKIGPRLREETFIGGALGANNPCRELIKEAASVFGDNKRVAQIVSLGAGKVGLLSEEQSDDLLKKLFLDCELVASELSTRLFNVEAYIRLNTDGGLETADMMDWSGMVTIETKTTAYIETAALFEGIRDSVQYLRSRTGTATLGQINESSSAKLAVKKAPTVSPYYVVRQKAWNSMIEHMVDKPLPNQTVFSITGMGGCGKTQLVSYFLQEKGSLYSHAVFVDASSSSSLKADLQAWAQSLGLGHEQDVWEDAQRILVNDDSKWVLVFDNADDVSLDLASFLPNCYHGTIIITSRNRDVGDLSNSYHLELGEMEKEEAISTLLKAARREMPVDSEEMERAEELARILGNLAVALVQAGTYCHQLTSVIDGLLQPFTFAQYVPVFYSQKKVLMKKPEASSLDNYQLGAYTAFEISYKAIPQAARDFLHFVASFRGTEILLSLFSTSAECDFADPTSLAPRPEGHSDVLSSLRTLLCTDEKWSEIQAHKAIHTLRSFSLITASSVTNRIFVHMHPLVQSWAREIPEGCSQPYPQMAIQVLTSCSTYQNLLLSRYLLPHVQDILGESSEAELHINDRFAFGLTLKEQACYDQAVELFKGIVEKPMPADIAATSILAAVDRLASTYRDMGRWDEAEALASMGLEEQTRLYGKDHRDTLAATGNLGFIYNSQGRYEEAEKLEESVLAAYRRILDKDDPALLVAAGNLACTFRSLEKHDQAIALQKEVLEARQKKFGKGNPLTIAAAESLAFSYGVIGLYDEAEKLITEELGARNKSLGKDHLLNIATANSLGVLYHRQGRYGEAEELLVDVLRTRQKTLGRQHPNTIETTENLSKVYHDQHRYKEAAALRLEVMEQRQQHFGMDHPGTTYAESSLAATYSAQGNFSEAARLQEATLERRRKAFGADHKSTMNTAGNLALTYNSMGKYREAAALQSEVLRERRERLGMDDEETLRVANNLASMKRSSGEYLAAVELNLEVLEHRRRMFGHDHPDTITSMSNLALVYHTLERYQEAEALQVETLEMRERVQGKEDPATLAAANNLALTYLSQGLYTKAEGIQVDLLATATRILGKDDPRTISTQETLASNYQSQGRYKEAEQLYREAVNLRRKVQGDKHPSTIRAAKGLISLLHKSNMAEKVSCLEENRTSLGQEHPDTLTAMTALAQEYVSTEEWEEAEPLLIEAVTISFGVLGKDHPDTQSRLSTLAHVLTELDRFEDFEDIASMMS